MNGGNRRWDLAAWVGYLRDIGVRELRCSAVGPPRTPSSAKEAGRRIGARRPTAQEPSPEPARSGIVPVQTDLPLLATPDAAPGDPAAELRKIRGELGDCTRCRLHEGRTNIVFGTGNPRAGLMFVGEGPGAEEDACGEPFVGRAGRKLDDMIRAIGLKRPDVYIANVVKCRPPNNRDPEKDEVAACAPFLFRQIEAIRPRVIVTLGSPATKCLLGTRVGITHLRGTWQSFRGIPVMPTFHPAYLLRAYTHENRRKVFDDLKAARARMDREP